MLKMSDSEALALLECYAMYVGNLLLTFRAILLVPSSRGPIGCTETSVVSITSRKTDDRNYSAAEAGDLVYLIALIKFSS